MKFRFRFRWLCLVSLWVAGAGVAVPSPRILLGKMLRADVAEEMPSEAVAQAMLDFEWEVARSSPRSPFPFVACVTEGYEGVRRLLDGLQDPGLAFPLYTEDTRTCYLTHETAARIDDLVAPVSEITFPLPASLKISKGLVDGVGGEGDAIAVSLSSPVGLQLLLHADDLSPTVFFWASARSIGFQDTDVARAAKWRQAFENAEPGCGSLLTIQESGDGVVVVSNLQALSPACRLLVLATLAQHPLVDNVAAFEPIEFHDVSGVGIVQSGVPSLRSLWTAGLRGEGQVVQVSDTGLDQNHCWFADPWGPVATTTIAEASFNASKRKVIQYVAWQDGTDVNNGHGSHVSGTVAGYDTSKTIGVDNTGAAPNAKLAFFDIGAGSGLTTPVISSMMQAGQNAGAFLFSISWGAGPTVYYPSTSRLLDSYLHANQDVMAFVSAGNTGLLAAGKTRRGALSAPADAKNCVTVGSSHNSINHTVLSYFTSCGPTVDGRIKPDVAAPGQLLTSVNANTACSLVAKQGTSMSTPLMAGTAALVRQYFTEGWYPTGVKTAANAFVPSGALLKAMIVNAGTRATFKQQADLSSTMWNGMLPVGMPPDIYQGFGIVRMSRVLRIGATSTAINLFVQDRKPMQTGDLTVLKFSIPPRQRRFEPFECTLTWTDPAPASGAAQLVLNNLDLSATLDSDARNRTIFPNTLARADRLNTVEKIRIVPTPGDVITVRIFAHSINVNGTQNYAFVASGTFASGAWYCQDPRGSREDALYRTEHCRRACDVYARNAVCCSSENGDTCDPAAASATHCALIPAPVECVGGGGEL